MKTVLSREQSRAFDRDAQQRLGVPSIVLMENAGRGAVDVILELFEDETLDAIVVVCGTGNNGGDGFVVARQLALAGLSASVVLVGDRKELTEDAATNARAWERMGGELVGFAGGDRLRDHLEGADLVVDALFGTGVSRTIEGEPKEAILAMDSVGAPVVALDMPSGIDADSGARHGVAVRAAVTVTFAFPKTGLCTPVGAAHAGRVVTVPIGVVSELPEELGPAAALLAERTDLARWWPHRSADAHKYRAGHVLVLGGSPGTTGAALLSADAALRAGAGAATIATWPEVAPSIESRVVEIMCKAIDPTALEASLDSLAEKKRAIVLGPGFGVDERAKAAILHLALRSELPIVLDADALTALAGNLESLKEAPGPRILLPHAGELARLLGVEANGIESDRIGAAREASARAGATVVLKGAHSVIASGQVIWLGPRGSPMLATAGSGDVLAGVVGALACHLPAHTAAAAGVTAHAEAGSLLAGDGGLSPEALAHGVVASEIAQAIGRVLTTLHGDA